jgi:hypothetical protein
MIALPLRQAREAAGPPTPTLRLRRQSSGNSTMPGQIIVVLVLVFDRIAKALGVDVEEFFRKRRGG